MPGTPQTLVDAFVANLSSGARAPKVVPMSDGTLLVAYAVPSNGNFAIKGRLFDRLGEAVGPELVFNLGAVVDDADFGITELPNGRVGLVAEVVGDSGVTSGTEIVSEIFDVSRGAAPITGLTHEADGDGLAGDADIFNPTITGIDEDGYRVYLVDRTRLGLRSVEEERLENGARNGSNELKAFKGNDSAELDSDTLKNGNTVMILDRDGADGGGGNIHYRVIRRNGSTVDSGESGASDHKVFDSTVTALKGGGGFVIAWTDEDGIDSDIQFQVFKNNGDARTDPRLAGNTFGAADENHDPAIAALDDGGFIIFYNKDAGVRQILGQRFDSAGKEVGETFVAANEKGIQLDATSIGDGQVALTYKVLNNGIVKVEIFDANDNSIIGGNGADTLNGTAGDDRIFGLRGDDALFGGDGDDIIFGGDGNDELSGNFGDDTLVGGTGNDVLNVLKGSNTLVFADGDGEDTVFNFDANNDAERIDLSAVTAITDFADLAADHMRQDGGAVVIEDPELLGISITLRGVDIADLDAADFIF